MGTHSTTRTPNPRVRSLVVEVDETVFANNPNILPPLYTPYSECDKELFAQDYNLKYGDYLYADQVGERSLIFVNPMKKEDGFDPTKPFRSTWTKFGNHRWCPILEGLAFIQDHSFPLATNVVSGGVLGTAISPKNYVREVFIQEVNEGSRFLLDELFSPYPFKIGRFPVPQPGRVSYQINGISGSFEECLHDDITIPSTNGAVQSLFGATQISETDKIAGQFFPRTNFKRRRPYVLAMDQKQQDGGYYAQRLRVFPPRQPRTTIQ